MKKLILIGAMAMSGLIYNTANAQISFGFGVHIHPRRVIIAQPQVVVEQPPVVVADEQPAYQDDNAYYDNNDDYYYLPDVEAYYSPAQQCYYYNDGANWISAAYLPGAYRDFDWRSARRYEIRGYRPYLHNDVYRNRFGGFEGRRDWNHFDRSYAYGGRFNGGFHGPQGGFDRFHGPQGNFNRGNEFHGQQGGFDRGRGPEGGFNRGNEFHGPQGGFDRGRGAQGGFDRGNGGQHFDGNRGGHFGGGDRHI